VSEKTNKTNNISEVKTIKRTPQNNLENFIPPQNKIMAMPPLFLLKTRQHTANILILLQWCNKSQSQSTH